MALKVIRSSKAALCLSSLLSLFLVPLFFLYLVSPFSLSLPLTPFSLASCSDRPLAATSKDQIEGAVPDVATEILRKKEGKEEAFASGNDP